MTSSNRSALQMRAIAAEARSMPAAQRGGRGAWHERVAVAAAIVAALFVSYVPALRAAFVWDDDAHLTPPLLRSLEGLGRIWFEPGATQQFYPLLHSLFWVEHRLWGDAAIGYHVSNLVLHGLAAYLLFVVLRRLGLPGAVLAAFVFALHPVHVESVAWISEQKNTLSAVFYFAAALAYLRFDAGRRWSVYACASGLFVLALLAKTVVATLPAALLVVLWWQRGRLSLRRDVVPLVPWFIVGAAAGLFTAWMERNVIGAQGAAFELSFLQRTLLAGHVVWFYAAKLVWPANLTFIYPRWTIDPAAVADWVPLAAALAVLALGWRLRTRSRGPLAVVLLFGGSLFPVLGFFNVYPFQYSFVADHFQYLASVSLIALGAAALHRSAGATARLAGAAVVAALAVHAHGQAGLYRNSETLFRATVARNPEAWMAHNNLAQAILNRKGDRAEAVAHLQRAVALRPDYAEALSNLGLAVMQDGRAHEGLALIERSLRLKPSSYQTHNNHAIALVGVGRNDDAVEAFRRAAALNPSVPNIHENLGKLLRHLGRDADARESFAIAAQLRQQAHR